MRFKNKVDDIECAFLAKVSQIECNERCLQNEVSTVVRVALSLLLQARAKQRVAGPLLGPLIIELFI